MVAKKSNFWVKICSKLKPTNLFTKALQKASLLSDIYLLRFSNRTIFSPPWVSTEKISLFALATSINVWSKISANLSLFCCSNKRDKKFWGAICAVFSLICIPNNSNSSSEYFFRAASKSSALARSGSNCFSS